MLMVSKERVNANGGSAMETAEQADAVQVVTEKPDLAIVGHRIDEQQCDELVVRMRNETMYWGIHQKMAQEYGLEYHHVTSLWSWVRKHYEIALPKGGRNVRRYTMSDIRFLEELTHPKMAVKECDDLAVDLGVNRILVYDISRGKDKRCSKERRAHYAQMQEARAKKRAAKNGQVTTKEEVVDIEYAENHQKGRVQAVAKGKGNGKVVADPKGKVEGSQKGHIDDDPGVYGTGVMDVDVNYATDGGKVEDVKVEDVKVEDVKVEDVKVEDFDVVNGNGKEKSFDDLLAELRTAYTDIGYALDSGHIDAIRQTAEKYFDVVLVVETAQARMFADKFKQVK